MIRTAWLAALFLCGCAGGIGGGTRFVEPVDRAALPESPKRSSTDSPLKVTVKAIILTNGPGSWIKDAAWDEYTLAFENGEKAPVVIEEMSVIDPRGVYVPHEYRVGELQVRAKALETEYKDAGLETAKQVGSDLGTGAAAGATGMASMGLLGAAGLALAPVALIAAPALMYFKHNQGEKDRAQIENEFARRALKTPAAIDTHALLTTSLFVPKTPPPKSLVVRYRVENQTTSKTAKVDLSGILMIAPPPTAAAP